jgi:16S rRNA (cytidine1402-2'-O)-methyltransferase
MKTGTLYLIATPIGNLGDMTFRAIETLKNVSIIAAEDTRHSRKLLQHYLIDTPMVSLHAFNETLRVTQLMTRLEQGESVGIISDAGTPLISDPGFPLVRAAQLANIQVVPIPGACAAITALCASGLPTDRFIFEGFLPAKTAARQQRLTAVRTDPRTLVYYESPHRIIAMLSDMVTVLGPTRRATIGRELTKQFETIRQDEVAVLLEWVQQNPEQQLGEFVVIVAGAEAQNATSDQEVEGILTVLLSELPTKQAASLCAKITGRKKNELYEQALILSGK